MRRKGSNLMLRKRKTPTGHGLEIDETALRFAEVVRDGEEFFVTRAFEVPLDGVPFEGSTPTNPRLLAKAIRTAVKGFAQDGWKLGPVHVNAANDPCVIRVITPPPLKEKELESIIALQLRNNLPMSEDEAEIRYELIRDQDEIRILAAEVLRTHVQALMTSVTSAGLRVASIEPRALAVLRAVHYDGDDAQLIANVSAASSALIGRTKTNLALNITSAVGESAFQDNAEAASRALVNDMDEVAAYLTNNVTRSFQIVVGGVGPRYAELARISKKHFGRPVARAPFHPNLSFGEDLEDSVDKTAFTTAIGLALKAVL